METLITKIHEMNHVFLKEEEDAFRCNKEAWQMSPNTSTALFTFPKDLGGLQIKLLRVILCSAMWGHLTRCCQFDDGTRQLAEITYKDALEKYGCLDM